MDFNRFGVSTKELVWDDRAAGMERLVFGPRRPVAVTDSNIATLTASADEG
jgi:hypothetical protein